MLNLDEKESTSIINQKSVDDIRDTDVLIVGLGETGIAAAEFLLTLGCSISISESHNITEVRHALNRLKDADITYEFGGHRDETFLDKDWILVSPGVPIDIGPLSKAKSKGIPVISDIELAYRLTDLPIIAVTGTNGKTTTTTLLGEILKRAGRRPFVGGNIGIPILGAFSQNQNYDLFVIEVSSFQLEGIERFAPFISIVLNITQDHLDRHSNMAAYKEAKAKILRNQAQGDYAILNAQDTMVSDLAAGCKAEVFFFDTKQVIPKGAYIKAGHLLIKNKEIQTYLGSIEDMGLKGIHNLENIMAASLAAYLVGISGDIISDTLRLFKGLPHRLEKVRDIKGIHFVNDSKGTNVGAMIMAIEAIDKPIILIAGGQDKGGDFSLLVPYLNGKIRAIFLIGEAKSKIFNCLRDCAKIMESEESLQSAVINAYKIATPGDTILLSPGCASFDMFKDYKDRGEQFKNIVMRL